MSKPLCVIVGHGPGVGDSIARAYGKAGYRLALIARNAERLSLAVQQLADAEIDASSYCADAADTDGLRATLKCVSEEMGDPEVVIYHGAAVSQALPSVLDAEQLVADFRVNVVGALAVAQAVLPAMRERNHGSLIFTGGGFAFEPMPILAALGIGKAGLRNLVQSLAGELADTGVRVGTVTICGMVQPGSHFDPDAIAQVYLNWAGPKPAQDEIEFVYR